MPEKPPPTCRGIGGRLPRPAMEQEPPATTRPWRDMMWPEASYRSLDPGIRFAVRVLHANGFETCQSCQGGKGHAYDEPTVEMVAEAACATGFGALAVLQTYWLPVNAVALVWPVRNGLPYEKLWRLTFFKTMEDRADETPSFVYGYQAR